jgi:flagellar biosynthetic protein FliR
MSANEPLIQATQYLQGMQTYWWPFCRILALLSLAPLFGHKALAVRVRILLALVITFALARSLPLPPSIEPLSARGLLVAAEQLAIGALLGLSLQLVFVVFTLVGEVISTQMGMSLARYNDPVNGVSSSSIVAQLYFILLVFLFFAIDGHLLGISVLYQSFVYWPVGSGLRYQGFETLIYAMSWVIAAATLITLPMVFCTTLVQFCFGLLNRISPAMNLFSLGFPMSIVTGLLCIYLTLPDVPQNYLHLTRELLDNIGHLLRGGAP